MKTQYKLYSCRLGLFILAGTIYYCCELLYRGWSSYTMFILAGLLGVFCIDTPNNIYSFDLDYRIQILISTILCIFGEGICGIIVNNIFKMNIWDYSNLPGTFFFGQCNVFFCFVWLILVSFGILICDAYNYYICHIEPAPYYRINKKIIFSMKPRN